MQRSVLTLFNYENFVPVSPKLEGAQPGYKGKFKSSDRIYLLKVEKDKRPLLTSRSADEHAALESLSSQLIRAVFGKHYAADTHLIDIGGSKEKPKWIGNKANIKLKVNSHYCILSAWEENCRPLTSDAPFSKNIMRIQTIAALINMDDYKPSNIVKRQDNSLFLVDCAGNFAGFTQLDNQTHFDWKIIKKFVNFNQNDLMNIIAEYSPIISADSQNLLLDNIRRTREKCDELLKNRSDNNELSLFGKHKPKDVTLLTTTSSSRLML